MSRKLFIAFTLAIAALLASCGGSNMSTMPAANSVPMTLTIGDTPPSGVAVLFFEASITGASLQPSDTSKPAVPVLTSPVEIEFGHLQTDTAFLSLSNVPSDNYSSLNLAFGNAMLTILNHSGAAIGSCANDSVCQLTPSFNPSSATVSSAPFPVTISANSVIGMRLDFDLNASVQSDLTIDPTVKMVRLTQRHDSDEKEEMDDIDEVEGVVTATGSNQFTLMNRRSGQSFTINVDSNTVFADFSENGMGTMLAKRVEFEEDASKEAIKGTITKVDSATQFEMVVFNEEPDVNGISEGAPVTVTIQPGAIFQVGREELGEDGGFSFFGLSFASGADLMVGQDVQVRPGAISTSGGVTTVTTDLVRLWPSQVSGQVASIDTSNGTFTLTGLSPLFTGATPPVTSIKVVTLSEMEFINASDRKSTRLNSSHVS